MCSECRQHPCHPRCPNADEPKVICECDLCGWNIYEGDSIYIIGECKYCSDCIENSRTYAD